MDATPHRTEDLLAHLDGMRRLARSLVRSEADADDLTQDAARAALEAGTDGARTPRLWLRGIVRNLARTSARSNTRRRHHERVVARAHTEPPVDETAAQLEVKRRLIAAVERLRAPYRQAIVERYFNERPPREIAQRLSLPVATVKQHLRRGLVMLREEMDASYGDRDRWVGALAPWLVPHVATVSIVSALSLRTLAASLGVAALLAVATWLAWPDAAVEHSTLAAPPDAEVAAVPPPKLLGMPTAPDADVAHDTTTAEAPAEPMGADTIRGTVVDAAGQPIEGFHVLAAPIALRKGERPGPQPTWFHTVRIVEGTPDKLGVSFARSDAAGRFVLEGLDPNDTYMLGTNHREHIMQGQRHDAGAKDLVLRPSPAGTIRATIVDDATGQPVLVAGYAGIRGSFPGRQQWTSGARIADGRFRYEWVPSGLATWKDFHVEFDVRVPGYVPWMKSYVLRPREYALEVAVRLTALQDADLVELVLDIRDAQGRTPTVRLGAELRAPESDSVVQRVDEITRGPDDRYRFRATSQLTDLHVFTLDNLGNPHRWTRRINLRGSRVTQRVELPPFAVVQVTAPPPSDPTPWRLRVANHERTITRTVWSGAYALATGTWNLRFVAPDVEDRDARIVQAEAGTVIEVSVPK